MNPCIVPLDTYPGSTSGTETLAVTQQLFIMFSIVTGLLFIAPKERLPSHLCSKGWLGDQILTNGM